MKTWQSVSSSHQEYLIRFSAGRSARQVTLFRDSKYVRMLNSALSLELGTLDLYTRCQSLPDIDCFLTLQENHRDSARQLRNLIVSNRGIPDCDSTALSTELCILAQKLGDQFGRRLSRVTAVKLGVNREKILRRKYYEILAQCPLRDRSQLLTLLSTTKSNLESLKSMR